jgi:release factor glutamine methyltransferase
MPTVRELIIQSTAELTDAGCASPMIDAEILMAFALNTERKNLATSADPTTDQISIFLELIKNRKIRIPLQHLTGQAYFGHLTLQVGPGVFIPIPETELLVQAGLDALAGIKGPKLAVDLCAGSGAVALSLALESPDTTVHAVELSSEAFNWLEKNVESYAEQLARLNSIVILHHGDATDRDLLSYLTGSVDVLLSNPPYIPDAMIPREPEVRDHDPDLALFGGADGLTIARKVSLVSADLVRPAGFFGMEHADVQSDSVVKLLQEMTNNQQPLWTNVIDNQDYNHLPRFVTAKRTAFPSLVELSLGELSLGEK